MNPRRFHQRALGGARTLSVQGENYLRDHAVRFAATYEAMKPLLGADSVVLSLGAGSAYVEVMLREDTGCRVIVADLPECLEANREHYEANGFESVAVDLSTQSPDLPPNSVDLVLSGEFIEHLPEAPFRHFERFGASLKARGVFVVSTPNYGSLSHIMRLLFMRPTLPEPEYTFGPVCFENEWVHRREYMPSEIHSAMRKSGFEPTGTAFTWYHWPLKNSERILRLFQVLVPRFRPCMVLTGRRT